MGYCAFVISIAIIRTLPLCCILVPGVGEIVLVLDLNTGFREACVLETGKHAAPFRERAYMQQSVKPDQCPCVCVDETE